jgi:hypothetical protein
MSASDTAGNVVAVCIVAMLLITAAMLWLLFTYWLWGRIIKMRHYIRHGAPDYKYLKRMEAAMAHDNLQAALNQEVSRDRDGATAT